MKLHTTLVIAAATLAAIPMATADADACGPPYEPPQLRFVTRGDVAQSAMLMVEEKGYGAEASFVLRDDAGAELPLIEQDEAREGFIDSDGRYGWRRTFEASPQLPPGTYTMSVDGDAPAGSDTSTYETSVTFTITADLPPEGAPPAPTLSWRALVHDGPEDPDLFQEPVDSCGFDGPDESIARIEVTADTADTTTGFITLALEDATGEVLQSTTSRATGSPRFDWDTVLYGDPTPDFAQCVTATFTDIYGRASEPTRSCKPDQCEARNRNDRGPIDWADASTDCRDWSPSFAERNAPGCGCAQATGAPASTPLALALLALGLFAMRRRI